MKKSIKLSACMIFASLTLSGCASPAFQVISLLADGVSYVATDKTIADHSLSAVTEKDCKLLRGFQSEQICKEEEIDEDLKDVLPAEALE